MQISTFTSYLGRVARKLLEAAALATGSRFAGHSTLEAWVCKTSTSSRFLGLLFHDVGQLFFFVYQYRSMQIPL